MPEHDPLRRTARDADPDFHCSCLGLTLVAPAFANPRIKDIAEIEGVRENQLVGYGTVVGTDGTGDTLRNSAFTRQSLNSLMERFNVNIRDADLRTGNVAAVLVTAHLPPSRRKGRAWTSRCRRWAMPAACRVACSSPPR